MPYDEGMRRLVLYDRSPEAQKIFERLKTHVVGQDTPLSAIAERIAAYRDGMFQMSGDHPVAAYLLLGPSGAGKTLTVEVTAAEVNGGDRKRIVKINGGEYSDGHEKARLVGSPPGFLGHKETEPALSQRRIDAVRGPIKSDLAVILFDELDKMHREVQAVLLNVLDKGVLETGMNTPTSFKNTMIFFTANFASRDFERELTGNPFNMERQPNKSPSLANMGVEKARKALATEFFNRLDGVFVYEPLAGDALMRVFDLELDEIGTRMAATAYGKNVNLRLLVTEQAAQKIVKEGTDLRYGARNLKRTMEARIVNPWLQLLSRRELGRFNDARLRIDVDENGQLSYFAEDVASKAA
jgi:ATP-dependent Clp protease ATP-binding subunit ClpB